MQQRYSLLQTLTGLFLPLLLLTTLNIPISHAHTTIPPEQELSSILLGITARTSDDAWAVGCTSSQGTDQCYNGYPLIEHWNGLNWQVLPSTSSPTQDSSLSSISAISKDDAWAVGSIGMGRALIEHWNGLNWQIVPSSSTSPGTALHSVSALSHNDVWAVGTQFDTYSLVEHWDGHSWHSIPILDPTSLGYDFRDRYPPDNSLTSVQALGPDNVYISGPTLLEHWDGHSWSILEHPVTGAASLSAISSHDLWAASGDSYLSYHNYVAHWNGQTWRFFVWPLKHEQTDHQSTILALQDNDVWMLDRFWYNSSDTPLPTSINHWNGHSWQQSYDSTSSNNSTNLTALAASSSQDVWAVGSAYQRSTGNQRCPHRSIIEHWNGSSWQIIPSNPPSNPSSITLTHQNVLSKTQNNPLFRPTRSDEVSNPDDYLLESVSAINKDDIWTVGYQSGGSDVTPSGRSVLKHWDGSSWQDVFLPIPAGLPLFYSIVALSPDAIYVAGGIYNTSYISRWDGKAWEVAYIGPNSSPPFYTIAAINKNDIWAAGEGVMVHWNGNVWQHIALSNSIILKSFAVVNKNDIWAVGEDTSQAGQPGIEHWDGKSWRSFASPVSDEYASLSSITAINANDLWAVGKNRDQSLIIHWNGQSWQTVSNPNPGLLYNNFRSITGTSRNDLWAFGSTQLNTCLYYCGQQTLIEHWDGHSWQLVNSPNSLPQNKTIQDNVLYSAVSLSNDDLWTVGTTYPGYQGLYQGNPLIEHWDGHSWQLSEPQP